MSTSSQPYDTTIPHAAVPAQSPDPAASPEVYAEVARLGLGADFPAVIALTRELFGDFTIDISVDPEIANCRVKKREPRCKRCASGAIVPTTNWRRQRTSAVSVWETRLSACGLFSIG
jgi:hypothetical protein